MNRILVLIVILLIPVTIVTNKENTEEVMYGSTLENVKLEVEDTEKIGEADVNDKEEDTKVLISNNRDKSDAFTIDLEEYIIGVVAGEMPASFNMEALKAQAIASRTFALYKKVNVPNYVLSTTINDQVYLTIDEMKSKWGNDFQYYYDRVKQAVTETEGQVITYNDDIIISYYFAISNGYTDDAAVVFNEDRNYLVSVDSSWDKNYKSYSSTRTISKATFCNKLNITCGEINVSNIVRSDNHYVREITINGTKFTGREVFNKLSLKSTDFNIEINGDNVIITTYGFGHGVGMSQYGAEAMAKEGYTCSDILKHYYKDTKIEHF